jgi:hypothetical protein
MAGEVGGRHAQLERNSEISLGSVGPARIETFSRPFNFRRSSARVRDKQFSSVLQRVALDGDGEHCAHAVLGVRSILVHGRNRNTTKGSNIEFYVHSGLSRECLMVWREIGGRTYNGDDQVIYG